MRLIDLHCDTITEVYKSNGNIDIYENNLMIDIKKLRRAKSAKQFFAVFMDKDKCNFCL